MCASDAGRTLDVSRRASATAELGNSPPMGLQYGYVAVFTAVGIFFVVAALVTAWALRPHRPSRGKTTAYECGIIPVGDAWRQFNIRFYLVALLFVLFDVEAAYLYPWALRVGRLGSYALVEMLIFLGILGFGLGYAWRKGGLRWE